jgi:hypothetical protein
MQQAKRKATPRDVASNAAVVGSAAKAALQPAWSGDSWALDSVHVATRDDLCALMHIRARGRLIWISRTQARSRHP